MIQRVHIKGFQALADVDIPLGRFTVIQGRSNSGKSAVIRALRAVVTNGGNLRGTGGSFIHHGSKQCSVEIERSDGTLVWTKTPTKTTYDLNGKVFTTGQEVPEAVAEFLKLGDIVIDEANSLKVNVNFQGGARNQGQFEPPFLVVDRTGSYLAKVLSLLTSANILYAAQAVVKKDSRASSTKLKVLREVHEADKSRLVTLQEEYKPLHAAAERTRDMLTALEATLSERDRLVTARDQIATMDTELLESSAELTRLQSVDFTSGASLLETTAAQLVSLTQWHGSLQALDQSLLNITEQIGLALPSQVQSQLTEAQGMATQKANLLTWETTLTAADQELTHLGELISTEAAGAQDASSALIALIDEIGVCPTCEQSMHSEVLVS